MAAIGDGPQTSERKSVLGGATEVNTLSKALSDLIAALKSKEPAATSDDVGRDLSSVQALQKKNNDLARDVVALAEKAKVLNADVDKVAPANPKTAPGLLKKQAELNETLTHVQELVSGRTKKLEDAEALATFSLQHAEVHDWLAERSAELDTAELPKDAASSQALLKKNDALRVRASAAARRPPAPGTRPARTLALGISGTLA